MSHEIIGHNKEGKEIAYVRFTMGDLYAPLFYDLLDANDYNGGSSGTGSSVSFTLSQIEKALEVYNKFNEEGLFYNKNDDFTEWQRKEMLKFIKSCLETARNEKSVNILFA